MASASNYKFSLVINCLRYNKLVRCSSLRYARTADGKMPAYMRLGPHDDVYSRPNGDDSRQAAAAAVANTEKCMYIRRTLAGGHAFREVIILEIVRTAVLSTSTPHGAHFIVFYVCALCPQFVTASIAYTVHTNGTSMRTSNAEQFS